MEEVKAFSLAERALNLMLPDMPETISSVLSHTESHCFNGQAHVLVFADNRLDALILKDFFDRSVQIKDNGTVHTVNIEVVMPKAPEGMN